MEFLEMLVALAALCLVIWKPEKENLAYWLTVAAWGLTTFMYVGHVCHTLFGSINI